MILNLKFEYRDITTGDMEVLLQDLQAAAGGKIYSITKQDVNTRDDDE